MATAAVARINDADNRNLSEQFARTTISLARPASTPSDYAQLSFPLPDQRYVGLLACQRDPNLRELETLVTRCTAVSSPLVSRSNGKEKGAKKKSSSSSSNEEQLWEVELLDTVLFPEGGGQASDTGTLTLLDKDEEVKTVVQVKEVVRKQLAAIHVCTAPLAVGARVLASVDWSRRHDLSTQHTSQHVFSAVLEHHFDLPTLGWALSAFPGMSYVELPRCPTKEELEQTERICNELIVEGRRVRIQMDLLSDANRPESMPDDYVGSSSSSSEGGGGVARTVIIDGLDSNPCCGTHYHSLAPLQGIHVSPFTTPIRGTNTRVYFMAGPRIFSQLGTALSTVRAAGAELSCASEDVPSRTKLALDNAKDSLKREKRMREELAEFVAKHILEEAAARRRQSEEGSAATAASESPPPRPLLIAHIREEDSTNDLDFLTSIQFKLKDLLQHHSSSSVVEGTRWACALGHVGSTTPNPDGCLMVFASEDAIVQNFSDLLKKGESKLAKRIRGGGRGRWQGKVIEGRLRKASDEQELLGLLEKSMTS